MPTTYSPEQLTAAHRLHDADREFLDIQRDEPAQESATDYEQRYAEHAALLDAAYHAVESAGDCYRVAFPDPADRPEAHEVIAAERNSVVELLHAHIIETVTQLPGGPWGSDDGKVTIDCSCGKVIEGEMPEHVESTTGSLQWLMAEHVARELLAAHR